MTMQVAAGTMFGAWLTRVKKLTLRGIMTAARGMSSYVLAYGGLAFVIAGVVAIIYPPIWNISFITGLKIHNLDATGLPFFPVVFAVAVIGFVGYKVNMDKVIREKLTVKVKEDSISE